MFCWLQSRQAITGVMTGRGATDFWTSEVLTFFYPAKKCEAASCFVDGSYNEIAISACARKESIVLKSSALDIEDRLTNASLWRLMLMMRRYLGSHRWEAALCYVCRVPNTARMHVDRRSSDGRLSCSGVDLVANNMC